MGRARKPESSVLFFCTASDILLNNLPKNIMINLIKGLAVAKIFISYRHNDTSNVTGRIFDHLSKSFDKKIIFKDVDSIPIGSDFKKTIEDSVKSCEVILAIIGDKWSTVIDGNNKRRLDDPHDFVRIEIEAGLSRGIPVIPVLVSGARMPNIDELPDSLRKLAFYNGLPVRPDPDFKNDIEKLTQSLKKIVTLEKSNNKKNITYPLLSASLLSLILLGYLFINGYLNDIRKATTVSKVDPKATTVPMVAPKADPKTATVTMVAPKADPKTATVTMVAPKADPKTTNVPMVAPKADPKTATVPKVADVDSGQVSKAIVESFDINGIKLGMNPDTIKELIDCNYEEYEKEATKTKKIIGDHYLNCRSTGDSVLYYFDENKKLFNISRYIYFGKNKPDWSLIKKQLINKYGKPTLTTTTTEKYINNKNINQYHYCWGECYIANYSTGRFPKLKKIGFGMQADFRLSSSTNEGVKEYKFVMSMILRDSKTYKRFHDIRYPKKIEIIDIKDLKF